MLGNGREFGCNDIAYTYQEKPGGIAEALGLAENFAEKEKVVVMLGDNIIKTNIIDAVNKFRKQEDGARILLKSVDNPSAYGIANFNKSTTKIIKIEEKPINPKTDYAVIGIYMYSNDVFKIIKRLKPSGRGELEITDVNNAYIRKKSMRHSFLDGWWADAGESIKTYMDTSNKVADTGANLIGIRHG